MKIGYSFLFVATKKPADTSFLDDVLSSQGFASSAAASRTTIGQLKRKEDVKDLDPLAIKVTLEK